MSTALLVLLGLLADPALGAERRRVIVETDPGGDAADQASLAAYLVGHPNGGCSADSQE